MLSRSPLPQGKYISDKSREKLRSAGKLRLALQLAAIALFVIPPFFLGHRAVGATLADGNTSLAMAYVLSVFVVGVWCIVTAFLSAGRYALRPEIPAAHAAKNGFEKHTWAVIEWQFILLAVCALFNIGMTAAMFSWQSLVLSLTCTAAAVAAYFVKRISFLAYSTGLTFVPPETITGSPASSRDESDEEEPESDAAHAEKEEAEDFYDGPEA